ncbi:MAG: phosphoribosyl-AMP cyclohydrolase [Pseudomonadota bacterium]
MTKTKIGSSAELNENGVLLGDAPLDDAPLGDALPVDETTHFQPKWDANGLILAIAADRIDNTPLMVAYMNEEALVQTLETGEAHFYSRSRKALWHKGGTSGNVLTVHDIRVDCDQDAIWLAVEAQGHGAACHTGRKSCFYRSLTKTDGKMRLSIEDDARLFNPDEVYNK